MGNGELEVEVTIASSGRRRKLWISSVPGIAPGRRVRLETSKGEEWWRITELGQIRLRALAVIDLKAELVAKPMAETTLARYSNRTPRPEFAGPAPAAG